MDQGYGRNVGHRGVVAGALVASVSLLLAACGTGSKPSASASSRKVTVHATTTTSGVDTTLAPTTTVAAPATTAAPKPASAPAPVHYSAPVTTRTHTTVRTASTSPSPPVAPDATNPTVPNEAPRATISATVSSSGGGHGWAAYLNLHDGNNNAVAMGTQSDDGDTPSSGHPMDHVNVVNNGHFTHAYGTTPEPPGQSHRWEVRYYDGAGKAIFFQDGTPLLGVSIKLVGRVFYQTEVNCKVDGDSVDATFTNVTIGGTKDGAPVTPSGTWNTHGFNFWNLQMQQTNDQSIVQGANMHGFGTIGGMGNKDWDTANPPAAAIGMITEYPG